MASGVKQPPSRVERSRRHWGPLLTPRWAQRPWVLLGLAAVHAYLGVVHVWTAATRDGLTWTHTWKGGGALIGTYLLAAWAVRAWR